MTVADLHLLTGAYALDAVDDVFERRRFELHLNECLGCREEVRSFRETAVRLAESIAVRPSPSLRARVLAQIAVTPQLPQERTPYPTAHPVSHPAAESYGAAQDSRRRHRVRPPGARPARRRGLTVAVAAATLLAGGTLAGLGTWQLQQARQTQEQAIQTAAQASRAAQDAGRAEKQAERILAIAADPSARRVAAELSGGGSATLVVAGSQAVFVAADAPALAQDRTYQLWVARSGKVTSAGLGPGGREAAGDWNRVLEGLRAGDVVAISVEPKGGSNQPTTTPLTHLRT